MKLKKAFYLVAVLVFLVMGAKNASADTCNSQKPGFGCVDTGKIPTAAGCVANLCPGLPNAVKCCDLSTVRCKDQSTVLQPCSDGGKIGVCNNSGVCIPDTKASAPAGTSAAATAPTGPTSFVNPLRFTSVEDFLTNGLLAAIQKIIVVIAVLFIAVGALLYVTAGANPDNAEKGKEAITAALIGLAIALAGPSLLKDLGATIGWTSSVDVPTSVSAAPGIAEIALRVLNFILGTLGILALIMMVSGAGMYLTSAGNEDQIDKGKEIIKYSFLGVLIAMASMVLVTQIAQFFVR